ncbi:hypothetical protein EJB05_25175, partial [Eragrostis curvula]
MATPPVKLPPEVLKAAKRGDWSKLGDFVREEGTLLVPEAIVDIDGEPPVKRTHTSIRLNLVLHAVVSGGNSDKFLRSATVVCSKAKHLLLATSDAKGDTPFHWAARSGNVKMLSHLIDLARRDGGDGVGGGRASRLQVALRKPNGRGETALHEAVRLKDEEMVDLLMSEDAELARFPCDDGASPLFLAILLGHDDIAEQLHDKDNQLSFSGPDGQNALHVAAVRSESKTMKDRNVRIYYLLSWADAKFGVQQDGERRSEKQDDERCFEKQDGEKEKPPARDRLKKMEDAVKETTTVVGVVSVLVITASFAAAFQLPGGYSTGKPEGTPELANKYSFQAFLVANNLAFFCSAMSIISLMYAGVSFVGMTTRLLSSLISIFFLNSSLRSLLAAFTFGTYAVLAPVAHATTVLAWLSMGLVLGDIAWFTYEIWLDITVLASRNRYRARRSYRLLFVIVSILFYALWPYLVIAGFMAYWKICGIK